MVSAIDAFFCSVYTILLPSRIFKAPRVAGCEEFIAGVTLKRWKCVMFQLPVHSPWNRKGREPGFCARVALRSGHFSRLCHALWGSWQMFIWPQVTALWGVPVWPPLPSSGKGLMLQMYWILQGRKAQTRFSLESAVLCQLAEIPIMKWMFGLRCCNVYSDLGTLGQSNLIYNFGLWGLPWISYHFPHWATFCLAKRFLSDPPLFFSACETLSASLANTCVNLYHW